VSARAVSSDPGAAYLGGLGIEYRAAKEVHLHWISIELRLEEGLSRWQDETTEIGCRNADRYRADLDRVKNMKGLARDRVEACLALIHDQQAENNRDYQERVSLGLAR
jgi:hypothetical protein